MGEVQGGEKALTVIGRTFWRKRTAVREIMQQFTSSRI